MAKAQVEQDKVIYLFGDGQADGSADMKNLLGGKGANLAQMCHLGLCVPPGFTIPTTQCQAFYEKKQTLCEDLIENIKYGVAHIEEKFQARFGDAHNPLLLSVRSGARASMPGMMDTVLNLGLNDDNVLALGKHTKNGRFAWDSYRRFIQMYGNVVLSIAHNDFAAILQDYKTQKLYIKDLR